MRFFFFKRRWLGKTGGELKSIFMQIREEKRVGLPWAAEQGRSPQSLTACLPSPTAKQRRKTKDGERKLQYSPPLFTGSTKGGRELLAVCESTQKSRQLFEGTKRAARGVMFQLGSEGLPSAWETTSQAEGLPWGTWLFTWLRQLAPCRCLHVCRRPACACSRFVSRARARDLCQN